MRSGLPDGLPPRPQVSAERLLALADAIDRGDALGPPPTPGSGRAPELPRPGDRQDIGAVAERVADSATWVLETVVRCTTRTIIAVTVLILLWTMILRVSPTADRPSFANPTTSTTAPAADPAAAPAIASATGP